MAKKVNYIVKESNAVARARIKPKTDSIWEERIISLLLTKVRVDDQAFHDQIITFEELNDGRAMSNSEHQEAVKAVERLLGKAYIIPHDQRGIDGWPIFSHIRIDDDGNIQAKFNPDLCKHYLALREQFALRSLPEFRQLSGTYSQQLFRFLNSWKHRAEVTIDVRELHELLSIPPSTRKDFKEFRLYVLERSHAEITEKTSLQYAWEPIRKGLRKVDSIRFSFGAAAIAVEARSEQAAREERERLKKSALKCWTSLEKAGKECKPKARSKRCAVCLEAGKAAAYRILKNHAAATQAQEAN
jgi:plasmid replication initiation protein